MPKASASSTFLRMPPPSTERYDAACEKYLSATTRFDSLDTPRSTLLSGVRLWV